MYKTLTQPLNTTWRAIWIWFYLAILLLGLVAPSGLLTTNIKLSSIFGCLIYTWLCFRKDILLQLAFLFTFIADILLAVGTSVNVVFLHGFGLMELGVLVFFLAQVTHFYRLSHARPKTIISILVAAAFLIIINLLVNFCPNMIIICGFYLAMLITNIVVSTRLVRREPDNLINKFTLIGFILFISCDICTGVSYLATNGVFLASLITPANYLAWFFYYPSQIFLSNSSKYVKIKSRQEIVL